MSQTNERFDFFFSYVHVDTPFVEALHKELKTRRPRIHIWRYPDGNRHRTGDVLSDTLKQAILASTVFVGILGEVQTKWVKLEIDFVMDAHELTRGTMPPHPLFVRHDGPPETFDAQWPRLIDLIHVFSGQHGYAPPQRKSVSSVAAELLRFSKSKSVPIPELLVEVRVGPRRWDIVPPLIGDGHYLELRLKRMRGSRIHEYIRVSRPTSISRTWHDRLELDGDEADVDGKRWRVSLVIITQAKG